MLQQIYLFPKWKQTLQSSHYSAFTNRSQPSRSPVWRAAVTAASHGFTGSECFLGIRQLESSSRYLRDPRIKDLRVIQPDDFVRLNRGASNFTDLLIAISASEEAKVIPAILGISFEAVLRNNPKEQLQTLATLLAYQNIGALYQAKARTTYVPE